MYQVSYVNNCEVFNVRHLDEETAQELAGAISGVFGTAIIWDAQHQKIATYWDGKKQ